MSEVPSPAMLARGASVPDSGDGVAAVAEVLVSLEELESLPSAERVAVFESVHGRLQDILATVDDA